MTFSISSLYGKYIKFWLNFVGMRFWRLSWTPPLLTVSLISFLSFLKQTIGYFLSTTSLPIFFDSSEFLIPKEYYRLHIILVSLVWSRHEFKSLWIFSIVLHLLGVDCWSDVWILGFHSCNIFVIPRCALFVIFSNSWVGCCFNNPISSLLSINVCLSCLHNLLFWLYALVNLFGFCAQLLV